jgi:hypothetical protein
MTKNHRRVPVHSIGISSFALQHIRNCNQKTKKNAIKNNKNEKKQKNSQIPQPLCGPKKQKKQILMQKIKIKIFFFGGATLHQIYLMNLS